MNLAICSLASGSSGNCYLIRSETTALLVDAGISARQIKLRLEALGLCEKDLAGILITHEHSDHVKALPMLLKKTELPVFASRGTLDALEDEQKALHIAELEPGCAFMLGDIQVQSFRTSHDAAQPMGFCFSREGSKISIVTDTGVVTEEIFDSLRASDILVLESNHDENILRMGRYPWFLKQRILGDRGHLSNEAAGRCLARLLSEEAQSSRQRQRVVLLAHLSKENNFPEMALTTVENVLEEAGFPAGRLTRLEALSRSEMSSVYWV